LRHSLQGIRNLLEFGIAVTINVVINQFNYRELPEYASSVFDRFGTSCKMLISFVAPTGSAASNPAVIPRLSRVWRFLRPALDSYIASGIEFLIGERCGIPLCVMKGYEEFHETEMMSSPPDFSDKTKPTQCGRCRWDQKCAGVWIEYAKIHGTAELSPVE
jgi:MoaA/NifB/PqqE/SkfB family radical SAM enzyme